MEYSLNGLLTSIIKPPTGYPPTKYAFVFYIKTSNLC